MQVKSLLLNMSRRLQHIIGFCNSYISMTIRIEQVHSNADIWGPIVPSTENSSNHRRKESLWQKFPAGGQSGGNV